MARGTPHSQRAPHPAEPLGGRPECKRGYSGPGRTPHHPIRAIAGSDRDLMAKAARAARGETVHHADDDLDPDTAGLLAMKGANRILVLTDETSDTREGVAIQPTMPELEALSLGARVKYLRRSRGLTIRCLAGMIGVSPTTIFRLEANSNTPWLRLLILVADNLDIHIGTLLDSLDENGLVRA